MIITCPNCKKKFNIDPTLIPEDGRDLKCGSCDHVWLYKVEDVSSMPLTLNENIDNNEIEPDKVEKKTGIKVVYTRTEDVFIPLWRRTQIANEAGGKLFMSVHITNLDDKGLDPVSILTCNHFRKDESVCCIYTKITWPELCSLDCWSVLANQS